MPTVRITRQSWDILEANSITGHLHTASSVFDKEGVSIWLSQEVIDKMAEYDLDPDCAIRKIFGAKLDA